MEQRRKSSGHDVMSAAMSTARLKQDSSLSKEGHHTRPLFLQSLRRVLFWGSISETTWRGGVEKDERVGGALYVLQGEKKTEEAKQKHNSTSLYPCTSSLLCFFFFYLASPAAAKIHHRIESICPIPFIHFTPPQPVAWWTPAAAATAYLRHDVSA
jgi:hypothetical protein